jgi:hypothetical protein
MRKIIEKYSELPRDSFKWVLITFSFGYLPILLLQVVLTLLEILPVDFNNQETYGLKGALVIVLFSPFIVISLSICVWLYIFFGNLVMNFLKRFL